MANTSKAREKAQETEKVEQAPIVAKDIDIHQYINVRSGFHGRLVYKSAKTGEKTVWDEFGADQPMELCELKNAKSASKGMFSNNYFMFDDEYDWVIDYLGVRNFYIHSLKLDEFDNLFKMTPSKIKSTIATLPGGQKKSVAYRAHQLIESGEIDSLKIISALEESLGIELIEK